MELLIDSAEILHNSKKYPISLALSVLAREESAKLEMINMHIGTPFGISKREWDSVTKGFVHENKLVNPVKFAQYYAKRVGKDMFEKVQEWGKNQGYEPASANYEDFMSVTEEHLKRLASLNVIKKNCFYLDWKNSDWNAFFKRSKEQLEAISLIELSGVKWILYGLILSNLMFREKENEKLHKEFILIKEKLDETKRFRTTKQFKIKLMIAQSVYKQYFKP